jgi:hypothetical protein
MDVGRYSLALERIKKLRTEKTRDLASMQGDLKLLETHLDTAHKVFCHTVRGGGGGC